MSTTYVTTTELDAFLVIPVGDRVIVTRSGELLAQSNGFEPLRLLGNNQAFVQGTVGGSGGVGINAGFGSGYSVTITSTGQVFSGGDGWGAVRLFSFGAPILPNSLTNAGEIHSAGGSGVESTGTSARLINSGEITARKAAMFVSGSFTAISNSGRLEGAESAIEVFGVNGVTLSNDGIMSGALYGFKANDGVGHRITNAGSITSGTAIWLSVVNDAVIQNTGTIHGSTFAVSFVLANNTLIANAGRISGQLNLNAGSTRIENSGTIQGAITMEFFAAGALTLQNTGTLAAENALLLGSGADRIVNTGTIAGTVALRGGDDFYDGREGLWLSTTQPGFTALYGQVGNDTILGGRAAETMIGDIGADLLEGHGGADLLFGEDDADTLLGGEGNDTLLGGAGADDLDGGPGLDLLDYRTGFGVNVNLASGLGAGSDAEGDIIAGFEMLGGSNGNDTLTGSTGPETLFGRDGNDILAGLTGNDRLLGNAGNDTVEGGAGADLLFGGEGNDVFAYAALADSTVATAGRDRIGDFQRGPAGAPLDRIDLSAIDAIPGGADNAFVFIGTAAFTAAGQVRYVIQAGARTFVEAETTGDNRADFAILLNGALALSASDFIL